MIEQERAADQPNRRDRRRRRTKVVLVATAVAVPAVLVIVALVRIVIAWGWLAAVAAVYVPSIVCIGLLLLFDRPSTQEGPTRSGDDEADGGREAST